MKLVQTEELVAFIDGFAEIFGKVTAHGLKRELPLALMSEIQLRSGKSAAEAVLVLIYACKYLSGDKFIVERLIMEGDFDAWLSEHRATLLELGVARRVQGNAPERGLPIVEVLARVGGNAVPNVIELGASFGLIGYCMQKSELMVARKDAFFVPGQQMPQQINPIGRYLGVDLAPPSSDWLLACIFDPCDAERIEKVIGSVKPGEHHQVVAGSALGFSGLAPVREFCAMPNPLVVITSFMLYQLAPAVQSSLRNEIQAFCVTHGASWYNQDVDPLKEGAGRYYAEWNGRRILNLNDDKCSAWEWLAWHD